MAKEHDWLPSNHAEFYKILHLVYNYISKSEVRLRLGLGPETSIGGGGGGGIGRSADGVENDKAEPAKVDHNSKADTPANPHTGQAITWGEWFDTVFKPDMDEFDALYAKVTEPSEKTPVVFAAFKRMRKKVDSNMRKLYKGVIRYNVNITDEDLVEMHLPVISNHRTFSVVPDSYPVGHPKPSFEKIVDIAYVDSETNRKSKPKGVHGAEVVWAILNTPPIDQTELLHSTFATASPCRLVFKGEDRGKTLFFALRWENNRADKGPWSPIQSIVIP
ncbi:MAG: hypothetical protein LBH04_11340 [Tannerellaceae bacterium]|jgi:hypothetical protein|nr:hypothetical protein [Tannerellaceae bacterium]